MITEFRKSIQSVLYERITSPLSGALFFSWIIWNWKILVYLFFDNSQINPDLKIDFIINNYLNLSTSFLYPVGSAILLIAVYPLFSTGALKIWLKYKNWQRRIKNEEENKQLLSKDDSYALRREILAKEDEFDKIFKKKDDEIKSLEGVVKSQENEIKNLSENKTKLEELNVVTVGKKSNLNDPNMKIVNWDNDYEKFIQKSKLLNIFPDVIMSINNKGKLPQDISDDARQYYLMDSVIGYNESTARYYFTNKGKHYVKQYLGPILTDNEN